MFERLLSWCNTPTSSKQLGVFRILFGLIMVLEIGYYYRIDYVANFFFAPKMLFHYEHLALSPLSLSTMNLLLGGMMISAILITLGLFYRFAIVYFCIVFSYFFFIDSTQYNNHIYLFCLVSFIMCFLNADSAYSVSKSKWISQIPQWQYRVLQFQIAVVLFYGGIAKINPFWFDLHPVKEILQAKADSTGMGFLTTPSIQYVIMLGGLTFDLLAPFLLWIKRTRFVGIGLAIMFNITNSWLFDDIFLFPFFMLAALILFVDDEEFSRFPIPFVKPVKSFAKAREMKLILLTPVLVYMLFQLAVPLRHYFYPGYADWTGEGQLFAWRMKIQHRVFDKVVFTAYSEKGGQSTEVPPEQYLTMRQYEHMTTSPRKLVQFAQMLEKRVKRRDKNAEVSVKVSCRIKFNGSNYAYLIDPELDILKASRTHQSYFDWIEPLPVTKK